jgi:GMP synthase-like glutamine amidotransferase
MSAWEDRRHRWMRAELRLIESMLGEGRPVLGVCLGAQLLARVLGARTFRGPCPEIGWFPVTGTDESHAHPVGRRLPDAFETFLWHEDSFDLPPGAVHLARSAVYEQQAFVHGSALALQFHLEVRPDWVGRIASRDARQLVAAPTVQGLEALLSAPQTVYEANNRLLDGLLDAWLEPAVGGEKR